MRTSLARICRGAQRVFSAFTLFLILGIGEMPAIAQNILPADEPVATAILARADGMRESYDKYPNSSSSSLVGLSYGEVAGFAEDMSIYVPLPENSVILCVRMVTQDARYFALNPYRMSEVPNGARFVQLRPLTQNHAEDLSRYQPKEYGIRTYTSDVDRCRTRDAVFLPQIGSGSEVLIAFVNANSRQTTAELFDVPIDPDASDVQAKAKVRCAEIGGSARIAFDLECRIPIDFESDGSVFHLRLVFDDGYGEERQLYKLLLPSRK